MAVVAILSGTVVGCHIPNIDSTIRRAQKIAVDLVIISRSTGIGIGRCDRRVHRRLLRGSTRSNRCGDILDHQGIDPALDQNVCRGGIVVGRFGEVPQGFQTPLGRFGENVDGFLVHGGRRGRRAASPVPRPRPRWGIVDDPVRSFELAFAFARSELKQDLIHTQVWTKRVRFNHALGFDLRSALLFFLPGPQLLVLGHEYRQPRCRGQVLVAKVAIFDGGLARLVLVPGQ
mmetsp:Transcript_2954/g.8078  ORF Transcript_2954/g.8078 Transcript_2954/m.8078 type:complete len:231 (+) Transcript_2954:2845-3537(+)